MRLARKDCWHLTSQILTPKSQTILYLSATRLDQQKWIRLDDKSSSQSFIKEDAVMKMVRKSYHLGTLNPFLCLFLHPGISILTSVHRSLGLLPHFKNASGSLCSSLHSSPLSNHSRIKKGFWKPLSIGPLKF